MPHCYVSVFKGKSMKHGKIKTPTYRAWGAMLCRCRNVNHEKYHRYGGRGIKVCKPWETFVNFYEDMGEKPEGLTLDRLDNDKGYYPENCEWRTPKEQMRNRSTNINIAINGETKTAAEWADIYGIRRDRVYSRIASGWNKEEAITKPVRKKCG